MVSRTCGSALVCFSSDARCHADADVARVGLDSVFEMGEVFRCHGIDVALPLPGRLLREPVIDVG